MTTRRIRGARKGAGWISGVRLEPEPDYLIRQRMELRKRPFHFDSIGLSLLVITVVCWEVMLSKGQEWDWLGDPFWRVQTLAVLFAAGLMGLIRLGAAPSTNLNSLFNMTRPVIEGMRERGFGRIINISSVNGQKGQMGQVNYSASKAGDLGFTKALAQENANKGVTVNAICPGYIATEMVMAVPKDVLEKSILPQIAVHRLGQPEEVARCVVFLASDERRIHYRLHALGQRRPGDVLMTAYHWSGVILWNMPSLVMPALLTRTSTGPMSLATCASPAEQASKLPTSHL